ncbi:hypothetical protein [uncultured Roseobacter sp.]|uniref:hypothetical protein n=1 Tax=uncultured Roseobacter sp. TaxID=114847 RepID=UPI00262ECD53|nr:hypothetical protein [uncultured Roseobacter sp.]
MNIAQLSSDGTSDTAAIEGFVALLRDGVENPEDTRATALFTIPEYPQHDFVVGYDDDLLVVPCAPERNVGTQVTTPTATIHRIFNEFETLDRRDPQIIGTITSPGNPHANHLTKSISVTLHPDEPPAQPAGWSHQLHALDCPNMSVNYFWRYY